MHRSVVCLICLLTVFLFLHTSAVAQQASEKAAGKEGKLKIAILEFEAVNSEAQEGNKGRMVAEMLTTAAVKTGLFHVVERHLIKKVMDEMEMGEARFSGTNAQKIGILLGADAVLSGSVSEFLGALRIDARLISVKDGKILLADSAQAKLTMEAISAAVQQIMDLMMAALGHEKPARQKPKEAKTQAPAASPARLLHPVKASASSSLKSSRSAHYGPGNVLDKDTSTAWVEGSKGNGSGQWLQLDFDKAYKISGMTIVNGYDRVDKRAGKDRWLQNSRVKTLLLTFPSGKTLRVELMDTRKRQRLRFTPVRADSVRFTILDNYKGTEWENDTCISEIAVYGSD